MDTPTAERQKLLEVVSALPDEALSELSSFLDYLHYKSAQRNELSDNATSFLSTVTGLGASGQEDVSERDEEILQNEIDPVSGWTLKPNPPA